MKESHPSSQSLVLRFMREKRKITLLCAGKKIGIKPKDIAHMENGRRVISDEEILLFLDLYHYSLDVFTEMTKIKPLTKQAANHYFLSQNA